VFKRTILAVAVSWACCTAMATNTAEAQVRGEILGPGATRMPAAIPELLRTSPDDSAAARTFIRVLRGDLELSGMFRVIDPTAYVPRSQNAEPAVANVKFDAWRLDCCSAITKSMAIPSRLTLASSMWRIGR